MSIIKATIDVEKGAGIGTNDQIECMFNPTEYTVQKAAEWKNVPVQGQGQDEKKFVSTKPGSFDLKLEFDSSIENVAVTKYTSLLMRLLDPHPKFPTPSAETKRPPFVWFSWGKFRSFKALVSNVSVTFTYFSSEGTPLRANATVTFEQPEEEDATTLQNPTSHTPFPHRVHRIQPGESLDRIASEYYGDPTQWRALARANGFTDVIRLPVGGLLLVPKETEEDG